MSEQMDLLLIKEFFFGELLTSFIEQSNRDFSLKKMHFSLDCTKDHNPGL